MSNASCPVCGSTELRQWAIAHDVEYVTIDDEFTYFCCAYCEALSIDPVPEDWLAELYPSNYYSFVGHKPSLLERLKRLADRRVFRKILNGKPGKTLRALDVGGGVGWLLDEARTADARLTETVVVDLDAIAKVHAERNGHRFVNARIEDYETDERFDLILILNLIEHVSDPVKVLIKLRKLLAPGGEILLKTPNHDSLDARLFRHRSWGGYHCPRHWTIFTPKSLSVAANKAGLEIASINLTQGAPFWAVSILNELAIRGVIRSETLKPMYRHPLFPVLLACFGIFDLLRSPFANTSQMFARLEHPASRSSPGRKRSHE